MIKVKIICPCCNNEILVDIDENSIVKDKILVKPTKKNKLKKMSKNLDIEFGIQRGGEKINE